jgi:hypothetical protein
MPAIISKECKVALLKSLFILRPNPDETEAILFAAPFSNDITPTKNTILDDFDLGLTSGFMKVEAIDTTDKLSNSNIRALYPENWTIKETTKVIAVYKPGQFLLWKNTSNEDQNIYGYYIFMTQNSITYLFAAERTNIKTLFPGQLWPISISISF